MEVLTITERELRRFAGLLGIVKFQGLAYTIMSLTCIIFFLQKRRDFHITSYMGLVSDTMYSIFLDRSYDGFKEQSLTPRVFTGFMWMYFLISLAWTLSSFNILNKNKGEIKLALRVWVYVTCIICLLDAVTVIILGSDYQKCLQLYQRPSLDLEAICANGILPVLVIAAKGFVLWFVNAIFARIIFKITKRLKQQNSGPIATTVSLQPGACRSVQVPPAPLDTCVQYPSLPQTSPLVQSDSYWIDSNNYPRHNYSYQHQQQNMSSHRQF